jgi:hypothetical protein
MALIVRRNKDPDRVGPGSRRIVAQARIRCDFEPRDRAALQHAVESQLRPAPA